MARIDKARLVYCCIVLETRIHSEQGVFKNQIPKCTPGREEEGGK